MSFSKAALAVAVIAYDANTHKVGIAKNIDSRGAAFSQAILYCGSDCDIATFADDGCVALATNAGGEYATADDGDSVTNGLDQQKAVSKAIRNCNILGNGPCSLKAVVCEH